MQTNSYQTPIVLFVFNRPDLTSKVMDAIRSVRPKQLFVVADAPRTSSGDSSEAALCSESLSIATAIDWDCELHVEVASHNLGCGKRISSGLNWVFSQVDRAVVLEDDILPLPSFFNFCESMLSRYSSDLRVMHVNGSNFQGGKQYSPASFYFSRYVHGWGWATWKRAWQHYSFDLERYKSLCLDDSLFKVCSSDAERYYWRDIFKKMNAAVPEVDTWDYQWLFSCWAQGGLAITPEVNLVRNIGFAHPQATHTTQGESPLLSSRTEDLSAIVYPTEIKLLEAADTFTFESVFQKKVGPSLLESFRKLTQVLG